MSNARGLPGGMGILGFDSYINLSSSVMRSFGMLFCAPKNQNREDCFLWNIDILFDIKKAIAASNFIDIDDVSISSREIFGRCLLSFHRKI